MKTNRDHIYILTDSGPNFGLGHYVRCLEIKNELIKNNFVVDIFVLSEKKQIIDQADIYIIDLPYDMTSFILKYKEKRAKVITLEYFDTRAKPDLNISVLDFPKNMIFNEENQLTGLEYIIIREEVRSVNRRRIGKKYGLVMLGGSINESHLNTILSKLKSEEILIKVIHPFKDELSFNFGEKVQLIGDVDTLPQIMIDCEWCVTNGGISMLEMIYLKKLTFAYPNTKNEKILSKIMYDRKLISGINLEFINFKKYSYDQGKPNKYFDGLGSKKITNDIINYMING